MKQVILVLGLALVAGIATSAAVGSPGGSEIAAGVAVFAGLMAIVLPLLWLLKNQRPKE